MAIKVHEVEILLGWVSFLALDFQYTLPPMIHRILVGVYAWTLGDIGTVQLIQARWRCSPSKVVGGPLILVMHVSRLHIGLDQLNDEATP